MTIGVYCITHIASGRKYVGKSICVEERALAHFEYSRGRSSSSHLHRAIIKYGRAAFTWCVLEVCADDASACLREAVWIRELGTKAPRGFNLTDGGEGTAGLVFSDEHRRKLSEAKRGKASPLRGRRLSEETRRKISSALVGHIQSESSKTKRAESLRGRARSDETKERIGNAHRGKSISEEARAKMSVARYAFIARRKQEG